MIKFYASDRDLLKLVPEDVAIKLEDLVWIDMLSPTVEDEARIEEMLGIDIPTREEMHKLDLSSRLYEENGAAYMTATLVTKADSQLPESHSVTFILTDKLLVTVRYSEPKAFLAYCARSERVMRSNYDHKAIFFGLMEAITDRLAEVLDGAGDNIDEISRRIFVPHSAKKPDHQEVLETIGMKGDMISKARESLVSLSRALSFASQNSQLKLSRAELHRLETIIKDIDALSDHDSFLSGKLNFLLDATLGMISIEQNAIIKIFSVAAVMFMPPTLVASIYGMNFHSMPELSWHLGYPLALGLMGLSAFLPYRYFKKKGWL